MGYRIINHPDLFVISANGSIYTKVPLDRELRSQYELVVEASDGAVDPRRTTLTLSIQVTDIDDNSPVFSQQSYVVNVPENTPVGTVVLKLSVSMNVCVFPCVFTSHVCFLFIYNAAQGLQRRSWHMFDLSHKRFVSWQQEVFKILHTLRQKHAGWNTHCLRWDRLYVTVPVEWWIYTENKLKTKTVLLSDT